DSFPISPARAFLDTEKSGDQAPPKAEKVTSIGDLGTRAHLDQEGDDVRRGRVARALVKHVAVKGLEDVASHRRIGIEQLPQEIRHIGSRPIRVFEIGPGNIIETLQHVLFPLGDASRPNAKAQRWRHLEPREPFMPWSGTALSGSGLSANSATSPCTRASD